MNPLELIRNGGVFAMAAVGAGIIGIILGGSNLLAIKTKGAIGFSVITIAFGALAAGLGLFGTVFGKIHLEKALANIDPGDAERIRQIGFQEAQGASLVGFGASVLPLLFSAVVLIAARRRGSAAPVVSALVQPREESPAPMAGVAFAFLGVGAMLSVGALVMSRLPLPTGRHNLAIDDHDGWALASAVGRAIHDPEQGCGRLDEALTRFSDPPPATIDWRPTASACVERWLKGEPISPLLSVEGMLASPLLHDPVLRTQVLARQEQR